jgi:hypothetical protein
VLPVFVVAPVHGYLSDREQAFWQAEALRIANAPVVLVQCGQRFDKGSGGHPRRWLVDDRL